MEEIKLFNLVNTIEYMTVQQYIEVTYNDTIVNYTVFRDANGYNINDVNYHFENNPYLENNQVKYDTDLTVLSLLFEYYNKDYSDLDLFLYQMEVDETNTIKCHIDNKNDINGVFEFQIKMIDINLYVDTE